VSDPIRVAVCDDARAVKYFLRAVLEEEGDMEVVSTTSTGAEVLAAVGDTTPDILLLDLVLPDVPEPADLVRDLRELAPAMAILLMSNMPVNRLQAEAERIGTEGWMPKAHKAELVRAAVREIVAGQA
jgi:DNA-binding NarL/FixJ family response regulator